MRVAAMKMVMCRIELVYTAQAPTSLKMIPQKKLGTGRFRGGDAMGCTTWRWDCRLSEKTSTLNTTSASSST
eukprot:CAMPEP_0173395452 /NCGR_PEP_ID=MMETSP1356-20130122/32100_1 /TAXON_ID=77927 ORGANISM="Hemiselmis virescens, Strain PCC157" /NCGR_SAMPLE_ID=MMETSP1356 /ASSEMBLY_ACC=CAM_ASM_000847 /LENGTH=71 /DNA_ID=CAMNT_0014354185 /DNA_START=507 /DNA_END=722 /DNA_ORIENTATION=-